MLSMTNISLSSRLVVLVILLTTGLPNCCQVVPLSVERATTIEAPTALPLEFCEISM